MSALSPIEWTDRTWNPVRGCSRVSEGCRGCYAERVAWRFGSKPGKPYFGLVQMTSQGPKWTGQIQLLPAALNEPRFWRTPSKVFVNSMSDLFHDGVPDEFIDSVWSVMARYPAHTYQVLTKRPERMAGYTQRRQRRGLPVLPHVWLGTSAEDQGTADERVPHLLRTLAAVRFVSLEPLLGPIDLREMVTRSDRVLTEAVDALRGELTSVTDSGSGRTDRCARLDWVIVGGESGPKARPMHPDWGRSLRDQCAAAGVPFFFKQWGEWIQNDQFDPTGDSFDPDFGGHDYPWCVLGINGLCGTDANTVGPLPHAQMYRVGKKTAGRLLDGIEHNGFPAP